MAGDLTSDTFTDDPVTRDHTTVGCNLEPCTHPDWWNHRLCDSCNLGDHDKHMAAVCWGCTDPYHDRRPGVSGHGNGPEHGAPGPGRKG